MNLYKKRALAYIKAHEGLELKAYKCTGGKVTIGYGRNLDDVGITKAMADEMLLEDFDIAELTARKLIETFEDHNDVRKAVLIDMAFNLGYYGLKKFKKFIAAVNEFKYDDASYEMLDSLWASQVGNRANNLAERMRVGF